MMHLGLLVTNTDDSAFAARHPHDAEKFAVMMAGVRPGWRITAFDLPRGDFPGENARFDGWIIGGSPASVHDQDAWIARLLGLIKTLHAARQPLFGACFGHQAIALALGGQVAPNPGGWALGVVAQVVSANPWVPVGSCNQYAAHLEQAITLPDGARVVGASAHCPIAAFAMDRVLTTQYHPEMTHTFITALVEHLATQLPIGVAEAARASLQVPVDGLAYATAIARFFEDVSPERQSDPSP
jgi:GMP synthase-like glutamine amidotransferase